MRVGEKVFIRVISAVAIGFIVHAMAVQCSWEELKFADYVNTTGYILTILSVFCLLTAADYFLSGTVNAKHVDECAFIMAMTGLGIFMLMSQTNVYMTVMTTVIIVISFRYIFMSMMPEIKNFRISGRGQIIIIGIMAAATLAYVGSLVVIRYLSFRTPNFDFGIFSQMYYYMKETGLPMTTCERGYYLSHFAIHFSPVYYLILPIYIVFPSPVTLIVIQLLAVLSGCIPLYMMCRNRKLSSAVTVALVAVFIFYPTMRSGLFYDFHENKFLVPLLLWLLYFLDNENMKKDKRIAGIIVFSVLSLMVKEDAAIYVACIGIYRMAGGKEKREKVTGLVILVSAVIYFFTVYLCLERFGAGSAINSIGRYDNLMTDENSGLVGMVLNMLKNPGYVIKTLLNKDKLEFVLWTMTPLLFVPFLSRKASAFILMIPYIVINLLTDYQYQYNIGFQYTYGSCTLLIYMTVLWFDGKDTVKKRILAMLMAVSAFLMSVGALGGKNWYYEDMKNNRDLYRDIFSVLETVPEEYSVSADTWFVPALSERRVIYEYEKGEDKNTDIYVFDMRSKSSREENQDAVSQKLSEGYEVFGEVAEGVVILRKK